MNNVQIKRTHHINATIPVPYLDPPQLVVSLSAKIRLSICKSSDGSSVNAQFFKIGWQWLTCVPAMWLVWCGNEINRMRQKAFWHKDKPKTAQRQKLAKTIVAGKVTACQPGRRLPAFSAVFLPTKLLRKPRKTFLSTHKVFSGTKSIYHSQWIPSPHYLAWLSLAEKMIKRCRLLS